MLRTCMISPFGCTTGEFRHQFETGSYARPMVSVLIAAGGAIEGDRAYSRQLLPIGRAIEIDSASAEHRHAD